MRNHSTLAVITVALIFTWLSSLAHAQIRDHQTSKSVDQQFAAGNNLLLQAATTMLETADAQRRPDLSSSVNAINLQAPPANEASGNHGRKNNEPDNLTQGRVQSILAREGVPVNLTAVTAVESSGNPLAISPKGARGLWQLMPATARRYGMIVDQQTDERTDMEKSTTAAARYLRDLYAQFGSWPLALAAYNTGEQNVQRAIMRSHRADFSSLSVLGLLPLETRNYVPAVLKKMDMPVSPFALRNLPKAPVGQLIFAASEQ